MITHSIAVHQLLFSYDENFVCFDTKVIETNLEKLIFYYGTTDRWVPVSYYEDMKARFPRGEIHLCKRKFDHAFVLESSKEVAEMVASWIQKVAA